MTTHAFSRRALLLPILAPLGALPFALTDAVGPAFQLAALFLVVSLVWGAVPYGCFTVMVLRKLAHADASGIVALAWWSPVRFAWMQGCFTALCFTGERLLVDCDPCNSWGTIGGVAGAFAIVGGALGYGYVFVAMALRATLRWLRIVRD